MAAGQFSCSGTIGCEDEHFWVAAAQLHEANVAATAQLQAANAAAQQQQPADGVAAAQLQAAGASPIGSRLSHAVNLTECTTLTIWGERSCPAGCAESGGCAIAAWAPKVQMERCAGCEALLSSATLQHGNTTRDGLTCSPRFAANGDALPACIGCDPATLYEIGESECWLRSNRRSVGVFASLCGLDPLSLHRSLTLCGFAPPSPHQPRTPSYSAARSGLPARWRPMPSARPSLGVSLHSKQPPTPAATVTATATATATVQLLPRSTKPPAPPPRHPPAQHHHPLLIKPPGPRSRRPPAQQCAPLSRRRFRRHQKLALHARVRLS